MKNFSIIDVDTMPTFTKREFNPEIKKIGEKLLSMTIGEKICTGPFVDRKKVYHVMGSVRKYSYKNNIKIHMVKKELYLYIERIE